MPADARGCARSNFLTAGVIEASIPRSRTERDVILSDPHGRPATARSGGGATLDALFRQAVLRRPDAVALVDPPDRARVTDGAPRRLTYAQADRMVSAIAGRLRRVRLATDAIVGLQSANTVD